MGILKSLAVLADLAAMFNLAELAYLAELAAGHSQKWLNWLNWLYKASQLIQPISAKIFFTANSATYSQTFLGRKFSKEFVLKCIKR